MRANQTGSDFGLRWTCLATSMAFAVAAAVHVLLWSWPEFSRARSAGTWPAVRGTVLRTDVTELKRPRGWKPFESSHLVTVLASYEMDGVMLLHRKLWLESGAEDAAERSRGWPAGAEATFQCDPDEPGRIVGDPQAAAVMFAMPGMLALLSLTFGLFPLLSRSGRWAMEPECREMPRTGAIVIGISFVLLTAVCLAWGSDALGRVRMAREIAGWPEVEATVVRSEWVLSDGDRVTAVPALAYRYERSGVMHESDAVGPVKPLLIAYADWNRRFLAHRPGDRVTARVDPADPERAVIEWPEAGDQLAGICGAAVFTLLGAAGTCNAIRSLGATRKPRFR